MQIDWRFNVLFQSGTDARSIVAYITSISDLVLMAHIASMANVARMAEFEMTYYSSFDINQKFNVITA